MTQTAKQAFGGSSAFWLDSLGTYSSSALEEERDKIEGSYKMTLAQIASSCGVTRSAYLPGAGVKQPTLEGIAREWAGQRGAGRDLSGSPCPLSAGSHFGSTGAAHVWIFRPAPHEGVTV
jgi:hypothetical protein